MNKIADLLAKETCGLIRVGSSNLGAEISLPALYPTGEHVTIVLNERDGEVVLHDGGFALQSISSMGMTLKTHAHKHISEYAAQLGCSFENGMVVRRCKVSNMAGAAMTVANVCLYVASQFQGVLPEKSDFEEIVRGILSKQVREASIVTDYKAIGASGGQYPVTAAIMNGNTNTPIIIVDAVGSSKSVNSRFRQLYDIKANQDYFDTERIAVYDDAEVYKQSDLLILQDVSNVVAVSNLTNRMQVNAR